MHGSSRRSYRDLAACTSVSVAQGRWDLEFALLSDAGTQQALVPALHKREAEGMH